MTFIASVIAKKGVAIIADSLVTSSMPILPYRKFLSFLSEQPKGEDGQTTIDPAQITKLFAYEPVYTKDFEEKLIQLNLFTCITTTGIAEINDKKIIELVTEFKALDRTIEDVAIPIADKIESFEEYLTGQIKEHLGKYDDIGSCVLYFTFYERTPHKTHIFRLTTHEADKTDLGNEDFKFVTLRKEPDFSKVVCDGQNKLSDSILWGFGKSLYDIFPELTKKMIECLDLPPGTIPDIDEKVKELMDHEYFNNVFFSDVEMFNLSELSLQQAVDLASLLMRLEIDFQKYTKNIPTVGGVVKLAIIDDEGFRFIFGDEVEPPKHIHL